jgi:hypothetical protein
MPGVLEDDNGRATKGKATMNGDALSAVWNVLLWGLGVCVSGFFVLAGWMWWLVGKVNDKATYEWIQDNLQASMDKKMDSMQDTLNQIKNAIVGDFTQRGLISKQDDIERDIEEVRKNCTKLHHVS